MSIAAQSRAKADIGGVPAAFWPLDVPSPDIQHRILGTILEFRVEVFRYTEMIQFVNRLFSLSGCRESAIPLYHNIIKECSALRSRANNAKDECDQGQYHSLAVEILLLQTELLALSMRASTVVDDTKTQIFREIGMQLLSSCDEYLETYMSCGKYESAVMRARVMLRVLGPFYEAVSREERNDIIQAMRGDYGSAVRWYYCRNGHPVLSPL